MNPLDIPNQPFQLSLANPNPRSGKSKDGPVYRVAFEVDQDTFLRFMDANTAGMLLECVAVVVGGTGSDAEVPAAPPAEVPAQYGEYAKALHQSRVLACDPFMQAIGTDAEYHAWVQRQPSCISGEFSEYVDGEGRCIAAHVRRAGQAGTGYKPPYQQIPLTNEEHRIQHQHGEAELLLESKILSLEHAALENVREWYDVQVFRHRHAWAWDTLKRKLGYSSWSMVPPRVLTRWCSENGSSLLGMLPRCYRDEMS